MYDCVNVEQQQLFYYPSPILLPTPTNTGPTSAPEAHVSQPFQSSSESECQDCFIYSP